MDESKAMDALVLKTAALMEQFERRCAALEAQQHSLAERLQQQLQSIPGVIRESADEAMNTLPGAVLQRVQGGLERPVEDYERRLQAAGMQLGNGAQGMATQIQQLQTLHRHVIWKIAGIALALLLLAVVGGGWLLWHYKGVIREQQLTAELLRAYNAADVTLCEGRLCANVDPDSERFGADKQYRAVKAR